MSFLKRLRKIPDAPQLEADAPLETPLTATKAVGFIPPPPRTTVGPESDPRYQRLETRRAALESEIQEIEDSSLPDGQYKQRITVIESALQAVEREIDVAAPIEANELQVPEPVPIQNLRVSLEPAPRVTFSVGQAPFSYGEEIDWAERGTNVVHGDLVLESGQVEEAVPSGFETSARAKLSSHLERSLFAFASDMRDRTLDGRPLPESVTLRDLALPCPRCGDWQLWGGICLGCVRHDARLNELNSERVRLLDERNREMDEHARLAEQLPTMRRRLAQTTSEMQAILDESNQS